MDNPSYFYIGADIGSTKTHLLIANQYGTILGFGRGGPGNHENVGYIGMARSLAEAMEKALASAGLSLNQLQSGQTAGMGFGISGYDWPSQESDMQAVIRSLGINAPAAIVNDALLGLLAGSQNGWGVAIVAGTGCNAWGWDKDRQRIGRVTGGGSFMGEAAGGSDLVLEAIKTLAQEWTKRGPRTALTPAFIDYTGATDLTDLVEGIMTGKYEIEPAAAPLIFQVADKGDPVANDLIAWAGKELGELAKAVIRQLEFQNLGFDIVLIGSLYSGSPLLQQVMQETVWAFAPQARFIRLSVPPAAGAVFLAMETAGQKPDLTIRNNLEESFGLLPGFI